MAPQVPSAKHLVEQVLLMLENPQHQTAQPFAAWCATRDIDTDDLLADYLMLRGVAGWVATLVLATLDKAPKDTATLLLRTFDGEHFWGDDEWSAYWQGRRRLYQIAVEDPSERQFWFRKYSDHPHECVFGYAFSHSTGETGDVSYIDLGANIFHATLDEVLFGIMEDDDD